ncbi:hypothetical protein [Streptomyces sp. ME01-18a]|uniref:hypothetical protein n=1 Tax=Streptomyces sp. ME01-18a TaxID=3028669 RepID=UPI0029C0CEE9|nr:hypothetical protein [Streptomyces sp. ME01-18a]
MARGQVRRQANGLGISAIEEQIAKAAVRQQEAAERLRRGGSLSGSEDLARLAATWAAKHAEWRRIKDLVEAAGRDAYMPERDAKSVKWDEECRDRPDGAIGTQRRERGNEVRTELGLPPACNRRVRAVAERAGLRPDELLAQLVDRVVVGDDGSVSVSPFTPLA